MRKRLTGTGKGDEETARRRRGSEIEDGEDGDLDIRRDLLRRGADERGTDGER